MRSVFFPPLIVLLAGCAQFNAAPMGDGKPFEPYADGTAAMTNANVSLPDLQMAYTSRLSKGGQFGPGEAFFWGPCYTCIEPMTGRDIFRFPTQTNFRGLLKLVMLIQSMTP